MRKKLKVGEKDGLTNFFTFEFDLIDYRLYLHLTTYYVDWENAWKCILNEFQR